MEETEKDLLGDAIAANAPRVFLPGELQCYQVDDCDWFAATSPEHALELMRELTGDDEEYEIELASEAMLDRRWQDEDAPGVDAGSLREYLAAATEPGWLAGIEP